MRQGLEELRKEISRAVLKGYKWGTLSYETTIQALLELGNSMEEAKRLLGR